jgi:hypothetical protein
MSLYECADLSSIGIQSETCFIKQGVINEYAFRFNLLLTLFDNDEQGESQAHSYNIMYHIDSIFIPKIYGEKVKDFSDLVKSTGKIKAVEILNKIITNYETCNKLL